MSNGTIACPDLSRVGADTMSNWRRCLAEMWRKFYALNLLNTNWAIWWTKKFFACTMISFVYLLTNPLEETMSFRFTPWSGLKKRTARHQLICWSFKCCFRLLCKISCWIGSISFRHLTKCGNWKLHFCLQIFRRFMLGCKWRRRKSRS